MKAAVRFLFAMLASLLVSIFEPVAPLKLRDQ